MFDPSVQRPPTQGAWSLNRFCAASPEPPCGESGTAPTVAQDAPMLFSFRATRCDGPSSIQVSRTNHRQPFGPVVASQAWCRVFVTTVQSRVRGESGDGANAPKLLEMRPCSCYSKPRGATFRPLFKVRHWVWRSPEPRTWRIRGRLQRAPIAQDASVLLLLQATRCDGPSSIQSSRTNQRQPFGPVVASQAWCRVFLVTAAQSRIRGESGDGANAPKLLEMRPRMSAHAVRRLVLRSTLVHYKSEAAMGRSFDSRRTCEAG
ncbi:hypothetical protein SCP_0413420 [Sparassis crispa]|uniref:Uncharacterized protein n=1 Tax=Sparassis crispa TaxID=139825 RepID=A0A401GLB5_9APHY|nr:hypothetical protein SCP_0413420 [Sparassis crispa]GBE82955.1 hypothetical protein SCP_0413420 [Sparassis crispa]